MRAGVAAGLAMLVTVCGYAQELKTFQDVYRKNSEEIRQGYQSKFTGLQQQYQQSLETLKAQVQGQGDLAKTKATMAETARFQKAKSLPAAADAGEIQEIKTLQAGYVKQFTAWEQELTAKLGTLTAKYVQALELLQKELVKTGKLDEATAVQEENERAKTALKGYANQMEASRAQEPVAGNVTARTLSAAWQTLDIAAACTVDIISTDASQSADQFTFNGGRLASASWLRKNNFPEPGLPDDGRVQIPDATQPGFFQVRTPPAKNAILFSGPEGAQPQPVTIELAEGERRRYSELSVLHCACWGGGTFRVLFNYETGEPVSTTFSVVDWSHRGRKGPLPAELRVAVNTRDTHPTGGGPIEMHSLRFPSDPERVLRSLTFSFESLTGSDRRRFTVALFAVSARNAGPADLKSTHAGTVVADVLPTVAPRTQVTVPASNLSFREDGLGNLVFDTGVVRGGVKKDGKGEGLKPLTFCDANVPIDGSHGLFIPYRFLTTKKRYGFGSWEWPHTGKVLEHGEAELAWSEAVDRPFAFQSIYRWRSADTLDLTLTFTPDTDLEKFELFLGSYFRGFTKSKAYTQDAGLGLPGFLEAPKEKGDMQLFPKNQDVMPMINDGRWTFPPYPNKWAIRPSLAAPLGLRQEPRSGVTVLLMAAPEDCFALSMSEQQAKLGAFYLSLFGKDVKKGQTLTAHARLVFGKNIADAQAVQKYKEYLKDLGQDGAGRPFRSAVPADAVQQRPGSGKVPLDLKARVGRWTNSLDMVFVPVPGTGVSFCIWETRIRDFEEFVKATGHDATRNMSSLRSDGFKQRGDSWENPGFAQSPLHPVCGVNWNDAHAFCRWLTDKEREEGLLRMTEEYRLPTDEEWSRAAGLDRETGGTPGDKNGKIKVYSWGTQWPPPAGAENYAGSEAADANWPGNRATIENYRDGYARTAPVGSFAPNRYGLYDLGGNLAEVCEDFFDADKQFHVMRGGAWTSNGSSGGALLSRRDPSKYGGRHDSYGFRVVVGATQQ